MKIILTSEPTPSDEKKLSEGIQAFNRYAVPNLEPVEAEIRFHVLVKSDGELLGGLRACCYWNTLHIELLWLSDEVRGEGAGRKMLEAAEIFSYQSGMSLSLVETTSWQAKPFYERQGYVVIGELEGRPKGQATFYLSKSLEA